MQNLETSTRTGKPAHGNRLIGLDRGDRNYRPRSPDALAAAQRFTFVIAADRGSSLGQGTDARSEFA